MDHCIIKLPIYLVTLTRLVSFVAAETFLHFSQFKLNETR